MAPRSYFVHGLRVLSHIEIPDFCEHPADSFDVVIKEGATPVSLAGANISNVTLQRTSTESLISIEGVARFHISQGERIVVEPYPESDHESRLTYLTGSVMGALLHQRGLVPLHASVVAVDDNAVAFLGPSGAGKSTLLGQFMAAGHHALTDDVCAVTMSDGAPMVWAGPERIRLWEDSMNALGLENRDRRRVRPDVAKFALSMALVKREPIPLKQLFFLQPCARQTIEIEPILGLKRVSALESNIYRPELVAEEKIGHALAQCVAIASVTKAYRVMRPEESPTIAQLYQRLLQVITT